MKVIFLDFDGVLNSIDGMNSYHAEVRSRFSNGKGDVSKLPEEIKKSTRDKFGCLFDERCVRWLHFIINKTNAKIVVSSTWRLSGINVMRDMWNHRNLPGEIVGITGRNSDGRRGMEISKYLNDNSDIDSYVIVDDEVYDITDVEHLVHVNGYMGIMSQDANKIIDVLNQ